MSMSDLSLRRVRQWPRPTMATVLRWRLLTTIGYAWTTESMALETTTTEPNEQTTQDLTELGLEQLLVMEVTSVSKKAQPLAQAAAAVFVVTQEDIRRSGANSIPEALRMVPGLIVARIDANKWAISSRFDTGRFADDLLVMVDGRAVYSPSLGGTFWEVQDTVLEDIDRIEVIRGPGGNPLGRQCRQRGDQCDHQAGKRYPREFDHRWGWDRRAWLHLTPPWRPHG